MSAAPKSRRRMSRRESAIYRRCKHWGVPYRRISRAAVFKRDKWTCGICRELIPNGAERRRYPDPLSPSIDHIHPLSVPGSPGHVWENVQAAHFGCNCSKGARYSEDGPLDIGSYRP